MNDFGNNGARRPAADRRLQPFEVFGDYMPGTGARVLVRIITDVDARLSLIRKRAGQSDVLDPAVAQSHLRAGLALMRSGEVSFAWANPEGAIVLLREGAGAPAPIENALVSMFAGRLSLALGSELPVSACIYELPDLTVVRRALVAFIEDIEDGTPLRSSLWLGAQLKGRGQPFHPSMIESIEEQSSLLQSNGIDMDALPGWWWRGMAAVRQPDGGFDVLPDIPGGDAFGELVESDA